MRDVNCLPAVGDCAVLGMPVSLTNELQLAFSLYGVCILEAW